MTETMRSQQRVAFLRRPVQVIGATPAELASVVYGAMSNAERRAWRIYCGRLEKIKGIDLVGYLELMIALSASGAVATASVGEGCIE